MYGRMGRESWGKDLTGAAVAMLTGYAMTSWRKSASNPLYPLLGNATIGITGIATKGLARNEMVHEGLEAMGYAGFGAVGTWSAEATTTFGSKGPGAAPVYLPKSASSSSGSLARRAQARAQAELARRQAGGAPAPTPPSNEGGLLAAGPVDV